MTLMLAFEEAEKWNGRVVIVGADLLSSLVSSIGLTSSCDGMRHL